MKITTWNVNGLRAALNKGVWDWIRQENPDVLCLQEIKARSEQISNEYHDLFNKQVVYTLEKSRLQLLKYKYKTRLSGIFLSRSSVKITII